MAWRIHCTSLAGTQHVHPVVHYASKATSSQLLAPSEHAVSHAASMRHAHAHAAASSTLSQLETQHHSVTYRN